MKIRLRKENFAFSATEREKKNVLLILNYSKSQMTNWTVKCKTIKIAKFETLLKGHKKCTKLLLLSKQ